MFDWCNQLLPFLDNNSVFQVLLQLLQNLLLLRQVKHSYPWLNMWPRIYKRIYFNRYSFLFIRLEVLLILINIIFECTILGSSTKAEALKCYACNSGDDSWCEDKNNLEDAGEQAIMECSNGEQYCRFSKITPG